MSCDWDETHDLADTLCVGLAEGLGCEVPDDEDELIAFVNEYNDKHGTKFKTIYPEHAFSDIIPKLWDTTEPGTEFEFERTARGDVDHVLAVISGLEDWAMRQDQKIWADIEESFQTDTDA